MKGKQKMREKRKDKFNKNDQSLETVYICSFKSKKNKIDLLQRRYLQT